MSFVGQLRFGKAGESRIALWLRQQGYSVLPVYEKIQNEDKGPVLFVARRNGNLIAPDLFCFQDDWKHEEDVFWAEAKTKSAFTWHRITERWVTGIDLRHYLDYLEVTKHSPFPLWLFFLHLSGQVAKDTPEGMESPTGLFAQEISYLERHENHRHENWGRSGMVYWAIETLIRMAAIDEVPTAPLPERKLQPVGDF